eukprot:CAMPEP_0116101712 /NCGR_PEP_ID=MMETSP0327-20121206/12955_1 /TAXON_ID=44447 /ORGANISM="Pseudo-nitzschia delicatissima, Strain B596" /LENGTH=468 /DNA_ID=CAMNT_0003593689 /DNA_START=104 /DNA_END=1507 /DNA_ORIENTATION=-
MSDDHEATVQSFVDTIPPKDRKLLDLELQSFVIRHSSHHRPIALVSSGGTAADLEVNSVRCLDNFSTGKRGSISVEEFLKRGYAVIHLWRKGSASPYGRVLSQAIMGKGSLPNDGISLSSLGKLFATGDLEEDEDDQLVQAVLDAKKTNDQWLSDPPEIDDEKSTKLKSSNKKSSYTGDVQLHRRIINSTPIRRALTERQSALEEGRILTMPFRTVEDYLAKLQLCSEALKDSQALALFYLAAAVSDFYVPMEKRSKHKIQSRDIGDEKSGNVISKESGDSGCLNLKLWPVPKVMGLLRFKWAPDAFVCSFKLETDKAILRKKAEAAVEKYGCHMVIGNLLKTRHDQVWVLAPEDMETSDPDSTVKDWPMNEITRPKSSETEVLEGMIIENVVQTHFEYISTSLSGSNDKSGTESIMKAQLELKQKKKEIERELFWNQVQKVALDWAGVLAGAALSYVISAALRKRMT